MIEENSHHAPLMSSRLSYLWTTCSELNVAREPQVGIMGLGQERKEEEMESGCGSVLSRGEGQGTCPGSCASPSHSKYIWGLWE